MLSRQRPNSLTRDDLLRIVAVHEAGHAVMAWYTHNDIREDGVSIDLDVVGGGYCDTRHRILPGLMPDHEQTVLQRPEVAREYLRLARCDCLQLLGGPMAEARVRRIALPGPLDRHGSSDAEGVWQRAELLGRCENADFNVWLMQEEARKILRRPKIWKSVIAVADAIIDRGGFLDGDDAFDIVERIGARRPSWAKVCA